MNVFLWTATALVVLELPLLVFASVSSRIDALVAFQASSAIFTLALIALAQGFHRPSYTILAVVASVLTFSGGMVFVRFFARELDP